MAEVGQRLRLKQHVGYQPDIDPTDEVEIIRNRHSPLFAGQIAEVKAIVPAGEDGAPKTGEDHVILAFEHHQLGNHRDEAASAAAGKHVGLVDPPHAPHPDGITRHWSVPVSQVDDLLEEVPG